jgi:drug/metabolite transporter (DMT)-like permease
MSYGFLLAAAAALCSASAAILQSIGAQRVSTARHVDPRLLWRLARCGPYAAGLALDGASSGLTFAALRSVPLFAVQAVGASNLSVIAVLTSLVLRNRLRVRDWLSVAAVVTGLLMLVVSAHTGPPDGSGLIVSWVLLGTVVALALGAYLSGRRLRGAALPGLLAGLTFGAAATAGRLIGGADGIPALVTDPAVYALALAGVIGTLLYAGALQRGSVTTASAMTVVGQTVVPALAGWLFLGDSVRAGFGPPAVAGFLLAVTGAVGLARHGRPDTRHAAAPVGALERQRGRFPAR